MKIHIRRPLEHGGRLGKPILVSPRLAESRLRLLPPRATNYVTLWPLTCEVSPSLLVNVIIYAKARGARLRRGLDNRKLALNLLSTLFGCYPRSSTSVQLRHEATTVTYGRRT